MYHGICRFLISLMGVFNHTGCQLPPPFFPSWLDDMKYINVGSSLLQQLSEDLSLLKYCYMKNIFIYILFQIHHTQEDSQGGQCLLHPTATAPSCLAAKGMGPAFCLKAVSKRNAEEITRTESWATAKKPKCWISVPHKNHKNQIPDIRNS